MTKTAARGRKSAGEGTVYQDEAGRWHAYVSMGLKDNGQRDRRHVSGVTRAVVVARKKELERKRDAQATTLTGRVTVGGWVDYWLDNIAARKVRTSTLDRYRQIVAHQIVPKLGHHRIDRLQPEHVEVAWAELTDAGLSPATVLQCHRVLSRALKVAMQRGRVARNVCTLVDPPSVVRQEADYLSIDEARAVLAAAAGVPNSARWTVALALGLRQGEALGLPWDVFDLDAGTMRVRQALQRHRWHHGCDDAEKCGRAASCPKRHGGGLVFVEPKSRAGKRTVMMPDVLVTALRSHRRVQQEDRLKAGQLWEDHGLVFCQATGKPIDPRGDSRHWHALLKAAGVRATKLHNARHTAASIMLAMGVPARVVMETLGHSQITLTLGTYSHVMPQVAHDAASKVESALFG
jgi:integrase